MNYVKVLTAVIITCAGLAVIITLAGLNCNYSQQCCSAEIDLKGDFCRTSPLKCCPGRDDACVVILKHGICYCDMFCNQTNDFCPDFNRTVPPSEPTVRPLIKSIGNIYFDKGEYEANVSESALPFHTTVITVTAKGENRSSRVHYEITEGNAGSTFAVNNVTGAVYLVAYLDYEAKKFYKLRVVASDNLHENFTIVRIYVIDENDNPPMFDRPVFQTEITEEDDRRLPKRILQVVATDGDHHWRWNIAYFLIVHGVDNQYPTQSIFAINATTGEIYILWPLDRDLPYGRPQWHLIVVAIDEGGKGLSNYVPVFVKLKDVNDNAPFFLHAIYTGDVTENMTAGMTVMTITATDYDDPDEGTNARLEYSIEPNIVNESGGLIFIIDEDTGVISTVACCLDRETNPEYTMKVVATDGGGLKGTATVIIKVKDINDMPPEFTQKEWQVEVDETEGGNIPEAAILVVSVYDGDLKETNRFSYKVVDNAFGADKFTMVTNSDGTGSFKIAKPLNFDDPQQRFGFNITIKVSDIGDDFSEPYHVDYAKVRVRFRGINDSKPYLEKDNI